MISQNDKIKVFQSVNLDSKSLLKSRFHVKTIISPSYSLAFAGNERLLVELDEHLKRPAVASCWMLG